MAVGLAGAGASWWFRYAATRRTAQFLGPEATVLIRDAPLVELIELSRAEDKDIHGAWPDAVVLSDESWVVLRRRDASNARGLVHLRHALLEDRSYIWSSR